jgi:hypothetical protein
MPRKIYSEEQLSEIVANKKCIKCSIQLSLDKKDKGYTYRSNPIQNNYICANCCKIKNTKINAKWRNSWTWAERIKYLGTSTKNRSRKNIPIEFLEELAKNQNYKDPFLGIFEIDFKNRKNPNYVSLDRINNNKGYTVNNIQLVPRWQNYARNSCTTKEFKKLLLQIKETFEKNK